MKAVYTLTFVLLFFCSQVLAQKEWTIKIYQNNDFFSINQDNQKLKRREFTRLSFAANFKTAKNYYHELELLIPDVNRPANKLSIPITCYNRYTSNVKSTVSGYSLRYEVSKLFNTASKVRFGAGMGLNPFHIKFKNEALTSTTFSSSMQLTGLNVFVVPQVIYAITQKLQVEVNLIFNVGEIRYEDAYVANPAIPKKQQDTESLEYNAFPKSYNIRFGIGYRL